MTDGVNGLGDYKEYKSKLKDIVNKENGNKTELFKDIELDKFEKGDWKDFAEIISDNKITKEEEKKLEEEEKGFLQFLIKLCSVTDMKEFDKNKNGKLDSDELETFVKDNLAGTDGNTNDISIDDFARYLYDKGVELDDDSTTPPPNNPSDPKDPADPADPTDPTGLKTKTGAELTSSIQTADVQLTSLLYTDSNSMVKKVGDKYEASDYGDSVTSADPALVSKMEQAATKKSSAKDAVNAAAGNFTGNIPEIKKASSAYLDSIDKIEALEERQMGLKILQEETLNQYNQIDSSIKAIDATLGSLVHVSVPAKEYDEETGKLKNGDAVYSAIARNQEIDKLIEEYTAQKAKLQEEFEKISAEKDRIDTEVTNIATDIEAANTNATTAKDYLDRLCAGQEDTLKKYHEAVDKYRAACDEYTAAKKAVMEDIANKLKEARAKELAEKEAEAGKQKSINEAIVAEKPTEEQKKIQENYKVHESAYDSLDRYAYIKKQVKDGGENNPYIPEGAEEDIIAKYGSLHNYYVMLSIYGKTEETGETDKAKDESAIHTFSTNWKEMFKDGYTSGDIDKAFTDVKVGEKNLTELSRAEIEALLEDENTPVETKNIVNTYLQTQMLQLDDKSQEAAIYADGLGWSNQDSDKGLEWKDASGKVVDLSDSDISSTTGILGFTNFSGTVQEDKTSLEAEIKWFESEQARLKPTTPEATPTAETTASPDPATTASPVPETTETEAPIGLDTYQIYIDEKLASLKKELAELERAEELETTVD
ncbi:MAG: hypothetical protein IJ003_02680 [Candidatus Gastranaerophilales bacterium]|nr:hypothetical protein [Candidatus Gastranaerophilales bacterium]